MNGSQFGKYRLIELLGRGGMGEVWRAHDTVIDRIVAIKILPAEISRDAVFLQRFRREAHAVARVNSPHVIPIHNHGEIDGRLFVDMKLVEGQDLQSVLNRGPLHPQRAVHIIDQVARALNATHKIGLLHRDVKPSNVLLDDDDFAYLIDFGIARAADELNLTAAGDVIGTFHYMAPERFGNNANLADARSDVYSLTCVLYECLTSQHPFPGNSMEQQITNHLVTPPPRPSLLIPSLPRDFDMVINRGMAKNPDERYRSAMELARACHEVLGSPMSGPVSAPQQMAQTQMASGALMTPGTGYPVQQMQPAPAIPSVVTPVPTPLPPPAAPAWWRRKTTLLAAAVVAVLAVAGTAALTLGHHQTKETNSRQVVMPFTGLREPQGLSVDFGGTIYVADTLHNRVLALPAGGSDPAPLAFEGLNYPTGVTADASGNVYVNDAGNKRVVMLRAGTGEVSIVPFSGLGNPTGLTVSSSRVMYIVDTENDQVISLDDDSHRQTVLGFTGLKSPTGVVIDDNGTIYVADGGNNRVLSLPPGSNSPIELAFTGLKEPGGVTVDKDRNVYVTDSGNNRVLKLPVGSTTQIELPFTGLDYPWGLAVDNLGTVYVAGHSNQVIALKPE